MNDRELLELAAKAAGYDPKWREWVTSRIAEFQTIKHKKNQGFFVNDKQWNPLDDDGDAQRLAVKLQLLPVNFAIFDGKEKLIEVDCRDGSVLEPIGDDPFAATRRAIVRAAAEIGKAMS